MVGLHSMVRTFMKAIGVFNELVKSKNGNDGSLLEVINGFVSYNQGWGHIPIHATSDGIAISVSKGKEVINSTSRYTWPVWWNILLHHSEREKASVGVIQKGLLEIGDIQNP